MSSRVHLGSQSYFEPGLTEPRSSRFKPDPQKPQFSDSILDNFRDLAMETNTHNEEEEEEEEEKEEEEQKRKVMSSGKDCNAKTQKKSEMGGWSFLQSLSYSSRIIKTENKEEKLYVHPLTRTSSSSSTLSLKSLEMCTESLGSETGSEEGENSSNEESHLVWSMEAQKNPRIQSLKSKRVKNRADFPPPLTSIRSRDGVRMKSHRENGRLVLKAEFGHCCRSCFQAERGNGRLRLRLVKNWSSYREIGGEQEEEEAIEGNSEIVGGEMGIEKFPLPGRCKKCGTGGPSRLNRAELLWVATT